MEKGTKVRLIRSNVATNLGATGTILAVEDSNVVFVEWDDEIYCTSEDIRGNDCYILAATGWVDLDRLEAVCE